jgi:hypothetical protein
LKQEKEKAEAYVTEQLFQPSFLSNFCQTLITKFIILNQEDLELWETEPETFIQEEEADHWEYEIRVKRFFFKKNF